MSKKVKNAEDEQSLESLAELGDALYSLRNQAEACSPQKIETIKIRNSRFVIQKSVRYSSRLDMVRQIYN